MSRWEPVIFAAIILAASYGPPATAQVRTVTAQPTPRPMPLPEKTSETRPQPQNGPANHRMPLPQKMPALDRIPYVATTMVILRGELVGSLRDEGAVAFKFENGAITHERILSKVGNQEVHGDYKYDRQGRLDRIEYDDGVIIQAHYGNQNELQSLTSDSGRTIRFAYEDGIGGGSSVAPTSKHFQSALALLRMKQLPQVLTTPLDQLLRNDGAGLDYFQGKEPIVTISAPRLPSDNDPSPIDFIPIGGHGPGTSGGGGGKRPPDSTPPSTGPLGDALDVLQRLYLTYQCRSSCSGFYDWIDRHCASGPTYRDQMLCRGKAVVFKERCDLACHLGDFTQSWQQGAPPVDYFPWQRGG